MSVLSYLEFFDPSVDATNPAPDAVMAIRLASERISFEIFNTLYDQALARIAAHLLELRRRALLAASSGVSGVGPATSVRTGDLAISWAAPASPSDPNSEAAWYTLTDHGREFLALRSQVVLIARLR